MQDNTLLSWILQGLLAVIAILVATWSWFFRHRVVYRMDAMETRINDLEVNTLSKSEVRHIEQTLQDATDKIETELNESRRIMFDRIDRTEDKIEVHHDRVLSQLRAMIDLINHRDMREY